MELLIGPLGLVIRYGLIALFGALASAGLGLFDSDAGTFTIQTEDAVKVIVGALSLLIAVVWRKVAKMKGGKT